MPPPADERVRRELERLVGLELSDTGRAADLRQFHFGPLRPKVKVGLRRPERTVMVGEFALHVQCPWRVEGPDGIVTGRADLWEPAAGWLGRDPESCESYDYDLEPNVQDLRMAEWLGEPAGPDDPPEVVAARRGPAVEAVRATACGGAEIDLAGGHRLTLFPGGSTGEDWRLFRPNEDDPHFVVSGGRVEDGGLGFVRA